MEPSTPKGPRNEMKELAPSGDPSLSLWRGVIEPAPTIVRSVGPDPINPD